MKYTSQIFIIIFLIAFFFQFNYFQRITFVDNKAWTNRTVYLSQDLFALPPRIIFYDDQHEYRYGAHPGTTIIMPAALLHRFGVAADLSLLLAITLLASSLAAAVAVACHVLRPRSPWWLIAAFILIFHPLYFYGTPTNVITGPAIALLFLLTLIVYEHRRHPLSLPLALFIALVIGLGLSVRLAEMVFIAAPLLTFIGAYVSLRRLLQIIVSAAAFAFISNPFLWFLPFEYLITIILRTASHIAYTSQPNLRLTPLWFLYFTPLTIISVAVALLLFIFARKMLPISSTFLLTLLLLTVASTGLFFSSNFKTLRYFYPLIFTWDVFLPLFLLRLARQFEFPFITAARNLTLARHLARLAIIGVIVFGFSFLTVYNLILPGSQGLI